MLKSTEAVAEEEEKRRIPEKPIECTTSYERIKKDMDHRLSTSHPSSPPPPPSRRLDYQLICSASSSSSSGALKALAVK